MQQTFEDTEGTMFQDFPHSIEIGEGIVTKSGTDLSVMELEYLVQTEIESLKLSPVVISFQNGTIREEFIQGKGIADWNENERKTMIPKLALALKQLHEHLPSEELRKLLTREFNKEGKYVGEKILDWMMMDAEKDLGDLFEKIRKIVKLGDMSLAKFDYNLSIIHGDLNTGNIIDRSGEIYFIDWTDVRYDLASLDIVQLFYINLFSADEINLFFENYKPEYLTDELFDSHMLLLCLYDLIKSNKQLEQIEKIISKYE